jgi:phage-related protein
MPETTVCFYCENHGGSPILEWFKELRRTDKRAFAACRARILLLRLMGHELRRPYADSLRDGIHELRARSGRVHYRLLYFFHGQDIAVVAHGLSKEGAVPEQEIERALERKRRYEQEPAKHRAEAGPEDL